MKNKLLILSLALVLALTACNKNKSTDNKDDNNTNITEDVKSPEKTEELPENEIIAPTDVENKENAENNENNEKTEKTEEEITREEELKSLEEHSDYISILKISQTGENGREIHVIEDLKGTLQNIVIPEIPNLEPNKSYLVFLMDSSTGDITLTDIDKAIIEVDGNDNADLKIIRDILKPAEKNENSTN